LERDASGYWNMHEMIMLQQAVKALSDEWFELYWRGEMPQIEQLHGIF
jgi:hypothetical protein